MPTMPYWTSHTRCISALSATHSAAVHAYAARPTATIRCLRPCPCCRQDTVQLSQQVRHVHADLRCRHVQVYGFNIPANMYAAGALQRLLALNTAVWGSKEVE